MQEAVDGSAPLVQLDADHPGFRDPDYRHRRNQIARLAMELGPNDPLPTVDYSPVEEGVWSTALQHLLPLHARYACAEHLDAWPILCFSPERIPRFGAVNAVLGARSGFRLWPVAGLISPRMFMSALADGCFLATQYIRHHSTPLYTPEPDVIHELVGHAALLADERFARVNRLFGEATRAADDATVERLIRIYWYTLEFGAVREDGELKVIGAGLLSSFGELGRFAGVEKHRFDLDEIGQTAFDPTHYQKGCFVGESCDALLGALEARLSAIAR